MRDGFSVGERARFYHRQQRWSSGSPEGYDGNDR